MVAAIPSCVIGMRRARTRPARNHDAPSMQYAIERMRWPMPVSTDVCRTFQGFARLCKMPGTRTGPNGWKARVMATIHEALLFAPPEVEEFFLLRCDEGLQEGACDWIKSEVVPLLEAELDYANLRGRARVAIDARAEKDHPVLAVERARVAENGGPSTHECWFCGEVLLAERLNCPCCGRNQRKQL